MREIKFRFWDTKENRWMIDGRDETNIYDFAFKSGMNWDFLTKAEAVERVIVEQYTGLKDKNGKEIYIGHEYKWYQPLVENGRQIRKEHISVVTDDIVELYYLHNKAENCWGGVEIIGNIHEKPELLE